MSRNFVDLSPGTLSGCYLLAILTLLVQGCWGPGRNDFHVMLGGGYYLWRCNSVDVSVSPQAYSDDTPIIPATVTHLNYDVRFVFAVRVPPGKREQEYWILDTSKPQSYGPLTHEVYRKKLAELGIKEEPVLKDVYEFRGR